MIHMKKNEYGLQFVHEDLLELLKSFDSICRTNNIEYSLYAGTLLGAIREKGFIPWDDDADVIMVYREYVKLVKIMKNNDKYYIDTTDAWVPRFRRKNEKNGAFIDLFWLSNAPENTVSFQIKISELKILQGMLKKYKSEKEISKLYQVLLWGTKTIGSLFSRSSLLKKYRTISLRNERQQSSMYSIPNAAFSYLKYRFDKKTIGNKYTDIIFEDQLLRTFTSWDYILKTVYGTDYMTPPSQKYRVRSHANQMNS